MHHIKKPNIVVYGKQESYNFEEMFHPSTLELR